MQAFVYAIKDPVTRRVRYIGFTRTRVGARLRIHLCFARGGYGCGNVGKWMMKMLKRNKFWMPLIEVVESIEIDSTQKNSCAQEKRWIKHYSVKYPDLLNCLHRR